MNGKSVMLLVLAVVCGVGAMVGVRKLTSKQETSGEMVNVLVAAREIKEEEVLKEDMVKTVQFPKSHVPAGAVLTYKEIEGRWVKIAMLTGDPIVEAKLAPKDAPIGLTSRIPKGMRAVAIEVNERTGVSGFILPDHRVDVIQSKGIAPGPGGGANSETILEDVQVLAVGNSMVRPDDKAVQIRTVTLALKPEGAGIIVAAGDKGPLSLSLRGVDDHAPVRTAKPKPKKTTLPVLVAARDLKPGEPIQADMVTVKEMHQGDAPARAATSAAEVTGKTLQIPIFAGEPIHLAKLVGEVPPGPDTGPRPQPGMRAVTIQVDNSTNSGTKIVKGEYIDVILTSKSGASEPAAGAQSGATSGLASTRSRVVLQDILVLQAQGSGDASQAGAPWTLTLEVHPRDLTVLTEARVAGTLTVALRDPGDHRRYTPPRYVPARFVERKGVVFSGLLPPQTYMIERRKVTEDLYIGERFDDPSKPEAVTVDRGR